MLIWLAETTIVASALAGIAALAARPRTIGPTARHVLWLAVLIRLLTPPMACWPWAVRWVEPAPPAILPADPDGGSGPTLRDIAIDKAASAAGIPADPPASIRARAERFLIAAWLVAGAGMAVVQGRRILQFRRRLRLAVPAPEEMVDEARGIAGALGARVPEILIVPGIASPMLWCLGRPRLLLPAPLVGAIDHDRWRGILAHELAHLRRGDHWVSRLELIAGLAWWWNPLYRLARARIDAEAELACDAWVVWALPDDRLAYAEALFEIGSRSSRTVVPAPALGVAGPGRLLERRLTMILRENVGCRVSPTALLTAVLLVLLASPSWTAAGPAAPPAAGDDPGLRALVAATEPAPPADDDEDKGKDKDKDKGKARKDDGAQGDEDAPGAKTEPGRKRAEIQLRIESSDPEMAKKLEAIARELRAKLGPGSDFEKQMKALGKDMEVRFRPGSDFEKQMKALGKDMEVKFGPGSDFEKKARELGALSKEYAGYRVRLGKAPRRPEGKAEAGAKEEPGDREKAEAEAALRVAEDRAAWARRMKEKGYVSEAKLKAEEAALKKARAARAKAGDQKPEKPRARAAARRQLEARIAAMEAQLRKLSEELRELGDDEDER